MSTLAEIEAALEKLPPEQWTAIRRWMEQHEPRSRNATSKGPDLMPDFLKRQQARFGNRVLPDSAAILDEIRSERL